MQVKGYQLNKSSLYLPPLAWLAWRVSGGQLMGQSHCRFDDLTTFDSGQQRAGPSFSRPSSELLHAPRIRYINREKSIPLTCADLRLDCSALSTLLTSSLENFNAGRFMLPIISLRLYMHACTPFDIFLLGFTNRMYLFNLHIFHLNWIFCILFCLFEAFKVSDLWPNGKLKFSNLKRSASWAVDRYLCPINETARIKVSQPKLPNPKPSKSTDIKTSRLSQNVKSAAPAKALHSV